MRRLILFLLFIAPLTNYLIAQSLSTGTISSFGINTELLTATGGETVAFLTTDAALASGFIEVLLTENTEIHPEPEQPEAPIITDITENSAVVSWQKIEGATSYKLNVYNKEATNILATYLLDENGSLKSGSTELLFHIADLVALTEYYIETIAYKGSEVLSTQSVVLKTNSPTDIEAIDNILSVSVREGQLIIHASQCFKLNIFKVSGAIVTQHDICMDYIRSLSTGIYIVVLQNKSFRKVYKINIL